MKERKKLFSHICDLPYGRTTPFNLFDASKNSREIVQKFQLQKKIPAHNGCVNSISWNETGKYLLSGSDDQHLSIINGCDYSVHAYIQTGHRANIFSAKFLPSCDDSRVISSSGDGTIIYSLVDRPETSMSNKFGCHKGTAYEIMTVPSDPNTFLSCGEDRTVRWFDIRTKTSCNIEDCKDDVLLFCRAPVTSIAINPLIPYQLAVGCADSSVQIFDRRMLSTKATAGYLSNGFRAMMTYFTVPDFPQSRRITSLCYSNDGLEMLVSYASDYIYLFDIKDDMGKRPKTLTGNGIGSHTRPVMKRLRVRGDWSDTGPNSRPEAEAGENQGTSSPNNLVRRMTDILTRMLFNRHSSTTSRSSPEYSPNASSHSEEEGDVEGGSDSNNEEGRSTVRGNDINIESTSNINTNSPPNVPVDSSTQTSLADFAREDNLDVENSSNNHLQSEQTDSIIEPSVPSLKQMSPTSTPIENLTSTKAEQSDPKPSTSEEDCSSNLKNVSDETKVELRNSPTALFTENKSTTIVEPSQKDSENGPSVDNEQDYEQESETEANVQSIERSETIPPASNLADLQSPRSPSPEPSGDTADSVELMMEVDSWDSDSDDGTSQPHSSQSSRNRQRRGRTTSSCDEADTDRSREVKKEKTPKNVIRPKVKKMYTGHRNARTMIKESTFWGDNFVMSGSDCGHIFIWDRHTTELIMIMEADHHVVNCLQPHPFDPILASSGIDYDIKIWAPLKEEPSFDVEKANEIVKRNEIMLEVTKDTITVPASFMFNMFNTLNTLRNGHSQLHRWSRASRAAREARNNDPNNR